MAVTIWSGLLLHQITEGARAESDLRINGFVVNTDHQDRQAGYCALMLRINSRRCCLEGNVRDDKIRRSVSMAASARDASSSSRKHQILLPVDELPDAKTDHRMIVYQQNALPLSLVPFGFFCDIARNISPSRSACESARRATVAQAASAAFVEMHYCRPDANPYRFSAAI